MTDARLPTGFMWGTSTSAYQIEGGNTNCDWYRFELDPDSPAVETCGEACDSYHRYEEDLDISARLGLPYFRLGLEWSRLEPRPGEFDEAAFAHYRDVLTACRSRGITPVVTLHHFTLPLWVADDGGFESEHIVAWMARYARAVGERLGDLIGIAGTINEPNIVALMGYLLATFPPAVSDLGRMAAVNETLRACHHAMRDALREGPGDYPIGLPLSMQEWEAVDGAEKIVASLQDEMEDKYLRDVADDDYVGVQCYTKIVVGPRGPVDAPGEKSEMGYLFWPQVVGTTVRHAIEVSGKPVIITENGIGTDDDDQRIRYLAAALDEVRGLLADGLDVRGYFQWSLLDNFEWSLGYRPKFGLVSVDRTTFARTLKPSATWFAHAVATFDVPAP